MTGCIEGLRKGELPLVSCNEDAPPIDTLPGWFTNNRWETLVHYAVSNACSPAHPYYSGPTYLTVGSNAQVKAALIATGAVAETPFAPSKGVAQIRPSLLPSDYLDRVDNADGDDIFSLTIPSASENDQIFIVP